MASMQRAAIPEKHKKAMASMQRAAIPEKHKKVIGEMKKALAAEKMADKTFMSMGPSPRQGDQGKKKTTYTRGLIQNFAPGDKVVFYTKNDWSGKVVVNYPDIEKGHRKGFNHKGTLDDPDGSKGAVVYAGKSRNTAAENDLGWLLAWHSPPYDNATNKVYVECGNIDKYKTIKWDDIKKKLDASTGNEAYYFDDDTGAEFSADIDATGINPSLATVIDVKN